MFPSPIPQKCFPFPIFLTHDPQSYVPQSLWLGNKGIREHRDWGRSLGNIGTGNILGEHRDWGTKGLGNISMDWGISLGIIGNGNTYVEHRDWGTSLGKIGTGNHLWGISRLGNIGTGEHRDCRVPSRGCIWVLNPYQNHMDPHLIWPWVQWTHCIDFGQSVVSCSLSLGTWCSNQKFYILYMFVYSQH